jgi:predicted deacylase
LAVVAAALAEVAESNRYVRPFLAEDGVAGASIDIVPVANPWGWVYGYRYNGEGEDMNRDFASGRTR